MNCCIGFIHFFLFCKDSLHVEPRVRGVTLRKDSLVLLETKYSQGEIVRISVLTRQGKRRQGLKARIPSPSRPQETLEIQESTWANNSSQQGLKVQETARWFKSVIWSTSYLKVYFSPHWPCVIYQGSFTFSTFGKLVCPRRFFLLEPQNQLLQKSKDAGEIFNSTPRSTQGISLRAGHYAWSRPFNMAGFFLLGEGNLF